ncbi:MAG: hypothetical protein KDN05_04550 [Verrucomicrobiae bacterium]|nr:hypothetical protein [Verrucomicrobiae bacterium]
MSPPVPTPPWLLRIPSVFDGLESGLLEDARLDLVRSVGAEYRLVRPTAPSTFPDPRTAGFFPWRLPVEHSWPCSPAKTDGFVEKAAQALAARFGSRGARTVLVGSLDGGSAGSPSRKLASNLRGRSLQLVEGTESIRDVEALDPTAPVLYAMVGKAGLFAGIASPREANGFHPGGEKFIKAGGISRAGGKIAGALHHLRLFHEPPARGAHWLELGASPGGMTAELLERGYQVTAVDRAPLDERLRGAAGLTEVHADVLHFHAPSGHRYDAILCDMNGDPRDSMRGVLRLLPSLESGGLVVFTLKLATEERLARIHALTGEVLAAAERSGLALLSLTHLPANRREFTCLFLHGTPDFDPARA